MQTEPVIDRDVQFVTESSAIEGIKNIPYHKETYQDPEKGHFGAYILSQAEAAQKNPLKLSLLKKWQKLIVEEQFDFGHEDVEKEQFGKLRSAQNPKEVRIGTHKPPVSANVPTLIDYWIEQVNEGLQDQEKLKNDIEYCKFLGTSFLKFEKIHPFHDGNGRMGRILANYIATYCGRPTMVFESDMIPRNRYMEAHESEERMWAFMAKRVQQAVSASVLNNGVLLILRDKQNSTGHYTDPNGSGIKESVDWHELEAFIQKCKNT